MNKRTRLLNGAVLLAVVTTTVGLMAQDVVPPAQPEAAPAAAAVVEAPVAAVAVPAPAQPAAEVPAVATPAVAAPADVTAVAVVTPVATQENAALPPGSQLISVTLDDVPLADVVKLFTKISGANIIAATTNLKGSVTANLQDVAWQPAFAAILERQNLLLVEKPAGSGIFVIESRRAGEDPRVTETVHLKFAKVDKLSELLKGLMGKDGTVTPFAEGNVILLQASQQKITDARKVIEELDRPRSQVYIEARFVEMSAAASKKLGMKWDSLKEWGVNVHSLSAGAEYNEGELAKYKTGTTEIKQDISREFHTTTMVPDLSQPVTIYDPADPTKIVSVTYPYMVPQDNITYPYLKESGVSLSPSITAAPGAGRLAEDMTWKSASGVQGQISADDFRLAMSAFEQMDGVSMISNPKIIVANEEIATVDMTTKEPYIKVTGTRVTSNGGNTYDVTSELGTIPGKEADMFAGESFFSYGVTLKVTPRVSSAGVITVNIAPSISEWAGDYQIAGASPDAPITRYPIIRMKRINTVFSMQDGATAVIGGLTRSSEGNTDSGIPYLRKIPYIGPRLFGWKSREKDQKELVIFVTVGIVDPEKPMDERIGLPKNAVLTRDLKEPGDGKKEDLMLLKD